MCDLLGSDIGAGSIPAAVATEQFCYGLTLGIEVEVEW